MIKKKIIQLRKNLKKYKIDGYIVPKNDEFFSEYVLFDRLKLISNFTGSAGIAVILKSKNYLFVDGRYTIQAKRESGDFFKIIEIHKSLPYKILKNLCLGFDPKLFTKSQLNFYFGKDLNLKSINKNLIKEKKIEKFSSKKRFYSIPSKIAGESHKSKISKISKLLKKNNTDYLFISASENIAWLLNIRGSDVPFSPIPNCNLIIGKNKKIFLIVNKNKISAIIREKKINKDQIIDPKNFHIFVKKLPGKSIMIDPKTCSIYNESVINKNLRITKREDPCYILKSLKNEHEISSIKKAHVEDGVALTKFIYWIKNNKNKKISELTAEKKLEFFRKKSKNFLYPSFNTIAGAGPNGAIVHYRANKKTDKIIKKEDIFLCDSGGQYKYGTTDVTRTLCFSKQPLKIKNIFTKVLKGHIAVATYNLNKNNTGQRIDIEARKFLKKDGLDYMHGTGHGVGFFSNVHEGPQSISKFSKLKFQPGMVLSNEPGYYKEGKFGIRIENLLFIKKEKSRIFFENLTLAPIEKELINFKLLNKKERNYLFNYHLTVYSKLSKYLDNREKKWLVKNL